MNIPQDGRVKHGKYVGLSAKLRGLEVGGRIAVPAECRTQVSMIARNHGMKLITRKLDLFDNVWVYRVA